MRTRIALVATVSVAVITVSLLSQLVAVQPARAANASPRPPAAPSGARADRLTSIITSRAAPPAAVHGALVTLDLAAVLVAGRPAGTTAVVPTPPPPPPPAVPVDTVTPAARAAWERVAMCEEGGNWQADGPRFSGGLGITRANWAAYGGLQYAPSGALATPDEQIMVAQRIQGTVPDQYGCRGW